MKNRKLKYSSIMLVGILIYILINISAIFLRSTIKTEIISSEKIEEHINKKGVLIRNEYLVTANMSGNIEFYAKEGEKVKKSDDIAYLYNKNISKENIKELDSLENEVKNIEEGNTSLVKEDVKKINKQIEKNIIKIQDKIMNNDIIIENELQQLYDLINDKNILLKSDLNIKTRKNKEEQINKISKTIDDNSKILKTPESGIVSYKFDGNESKFSTESIDELKQSDIEDIENKYKEISTESNIKSGDPVVRIVDNTKQYVAIVATKEEVEKMEIGNSVVLIDGENRINSKIYDIYKETNDNIVIFEISEQNIEIYDTRVAEFDIIYKSIEGIKIPKTSVIEKDNIKGVYIVSETGNAKFVEIKGISYENDEFIVVDYYKNKINGIKTIDIYDEIILEPKKVKEGSIVK